MVAITVTRPGIAVYGTPIVNVSYGVVIEAPIVNTKCRTTTSANRIITMV